MKKGLCFLGLLLILLFVTPALGEEVHTTVALITKYGNLELSISGTEFLEAGFACGDIVTVRLGGKEYEMPVGTSFSDVDQGESICKVKISPAEEEDKVTLAYNVDDLATSAGIAVKETISEDPGYVWIIAEGENDPIEVTISLKEKEGYLEEWLLRKLVRSNERGDYPELSDEEYANFRMVSSSGMGEGVLYRSSSPLSPELNRSKEADKACQEAGIHTIINLADTPISLQYYEGFADSYYASCQYICLGLGFDYGSSSFQERVALGLRFMMENEPPYLIHCMEGKDRTGFVCALLECLMGAGEEEVKDDYMATYYNYYAVEEGGESYEAIVSSNIVKTLTMAFHLESLTGADLSSCAKDYCLSLGLTEEEVMALMDRLDGEAGAKGAA